MLSIVVMNIDGYIIINDFSIGYGNILKKNMDYLLYCDRIIHLKFSAFTFFKKNIIY